MSIRALSFYFDNARELGFNPAEQVIMLILADQARDEGEAWPSIATVNRKNTLSEESVKRVLRDLTERGEIVRIRRVRANGSSRSSVTLLVKYRQAYGIKDDYSDLEAEALAALKKGRGGSGGSEEGPSGETGETGETGKRGCGRPKKDQPSSPESPQGGEGVASNTLGGSEATRGGDHRQHGGGVASNTLGVLPITPLDPLYDPLHDPIPDTSYQAFSTDVENDHAPVAKTEKTSKKPPKKAAGAQPVVPALLDVPQSPKPQRASDHPAVQEYRKRFGRFPTKPQMFLIVDAIEQGGMKLKWWAKAVENWAARGYNPRSIDKIIRIARTNRGEFEEWGGGGFGGAADERDGRPSQIRREYLHEGGAIGAGAAKLEREWGVTFGEGYAPAIGDDDPSWRYAMMETGEGTFTGGVGYCDTAPGAPGA